MTPKQRSSAPALDGGLSILEMLAQSSPLGCQQIVNSLSMSKSTTLRLLKVLQNRDYVIKDKTTGKYLPGPQMSLIGYLTPIVDTLRRESPALLNSLVDQAKNTAVLIYWPGDSMQVINKEQRPNGMAMINVGTISSDYARFPWGWIFYDNLAPEQQKYEQGRMEKPQLFTKRFPKWIEFYHQKGFCYDDREIFPHIRRLCAPIYDHTDKLIGAIGLGGNPLTIPDNKINDIGNLVLDHANKLTQRISKKQES